VPPGPRPENLHATRQCFSFQIAGTIVGRLIVRVKDPEISIFGVNIEESGVKYTVKINCLSIANASRQIRNTAAHNDHQFTPSC
jgi:hypothetical protein